MMASFDKLANQLFGGKRAETNSVLHDGETHTLIGTATGNSADGSVMVELSSDVTNPEPIEIDGEVYYSDADTSVELPTTTSVQEGDEVLVSVYGGTPLRSPVVTGVVGSGDRIAGMAQDAYDLADSVEGIAQQALDVAEATGQYFWHDSAGAHVSTEANEPEGAQNVLINAAGILFRAIANNIVGIVTGTDPGFVIYDGLGNAAANLIGIFTAGLIRIGRLIEESGTYDNTASIEFFDENSAISVEQYANADHSTIWRNMELESALTDSSGTSAAGVIRESSSIDDMTGTTADTVIEAKVTPQGSSAVSASLHLHAGESLGTRRAELYADTVVLDGSGAEDIRGIWSMAHVIDALTKAIRLGTTYRASKNVSITANTDVMGASVSVPAGTYLVMCWQTFRNPGSTGTRTTTIGAYAGGSLASYTTAVQATRDQVRVQHMSIVTTTGSSTTLQAYARSNVAAAGDNNSQINAICIG